MMAPWTHTTNVLVRDQHDRAARALREFHVLGVLQEEVHQPRPDQMPAYKCSALRESALSAMRRCRETVRRFHEATFDMQAPIVGEALRERQAFILWHVASRAAQPDGWETRRDGQLESVLASFCDDILTARERAGGVGEGLGLW
ncbi:hypothetical protein QQZ08_001586 [Neonectria magnoliae]|uniref:Uncharacterized protein n=1 Tax=Neonectria magnoliae TaxID=2732573 RepID=A0ABR1IEB2_9HYPO